LLQSIAVKQLEADLEPLVKQLAIAQSTVRKIGPDLQKLGLIKDITGLTGAELEKAIKYNQELQDGFTKLNDQQRKALSTSGVFKYNQAVNESNKLWDEINSLINNASVLYSKSLKQTTEGKNKEKTQQEIVNDLLKKYKEELSGINWDEQNRQIDGVNKRLELAGDTLRNLYLAGVKESSVAWKKVATDLEGFALDKKFADLAKSVDVINQSVKDFTNQNSLAQKEFAKANEESLKIAQKRVAQDVANDKIRKAIQAAEIKRQQELANTITNAVTPAVDSLFNAIIEGGDPFEALRNSIKSLIIELGKAVIKSLILKAVQSSIGGGAFSPNIGVGGSVVRSDYIFAGLNRGMASDKRLKTNIKLIGVSNNGINIYRYNYLNSPILYEGIIAQELLGTKYENALIYKDGFYAVDYSLIDVQFKKLG
jgi:hypothetical protein